MLLKNDDDKAGVNCTFTHETNLSVNAIEVGDMVTIKGEIVSGAYYDEDLNIFVYLMITCKFNHYEKL